MLDQYLEQLGLVEKERKLYLVLAEVGIQPASTVARRAQLDRVTAYKHLKKMATQGLIKLYVRDGVQCFGIESFDAIADHIKTKADTYGELLENLPTAMNLLKSLKGDEDQIPRLQMFEGEAGMRSLFRDMLYELKQSDLKQLRMLSSNTFEEWLGDEPLKKTVREFFADATKEGIDIQVFEVTGGLVPEFLKQYSLAEVEADAFPVAKGTTNIFVIGHTVYLASYRSGHIGLKIAQADMSQIFHVLFDLLGKKVKAD